MTRWFAPISLFLSLLLPDRVHAWGTEGHQIIADIAEAHLTPEASSRVNGILHGVRMRDVSNYADEIRPTRRETFRWHFVNIAPGADSYVAERDCKQIAGQGDCLIGPVTNFSTGDFGNEIEALPIGDLDLLFSSGGDIVTLQFWTFATISASRRTPTRPQHRRGAASRALSLSARPVHGRRVFTRWPILETF